MSKQSDYYRVLGVTPSANEAVIKRAYRALVKRYHPDTTPPAHSRWAGEQMVRINRAHQVFSDPERRALYDAQRGYAHHQDAHRKQPQKEDHPSVTFSGRAMWRKQRAREHSRRQRLERWQAVAIISAVALLIWTSVTLISVRTPLGYVLSVLVNGSASVMFFVSLAMVNR